MAIGWGRRRGVERVVMAVLLLEVRHGRARPYASTKAAAPGIRRQAGADAETCESLRWDWAMGVIMLRLLLLGPGSRVSSALLNSASTTHAAPAYIGPRR
jgi:hypothetical protein